ncbi:hypothetical protein V6N11_072496 [Hibiscus sabdariffa]|uniref:Uncharacterized protein n=1 Tax=Hibiscus sabdariffa TaxID=183260 RepID=A0ABR2U3I4_9ROSI
MASFNCFLVAFCMALSFSSINVSRAARHLQQLPQLPPMPTLPTTTLPPMPTIPAFPKPGVLPPLPSLPSLPTNLPNIPRATLPPLRSMPTIPSIPFLSPPPAPSMQDGHLVPSPNKDVVGAGPTSVAQNHMVPEEEASMNGDAIFNSNSGTSPPRGGLVWAETVLSCSGRWGKLTWLPCLECGVHLAISRWPGPAFCSLAIT